MGKRQMRELSGIAASDGVAIGRAVVISSRTMEVVRIPIPEENVAAEIERFRAACVETQREIQSTRKKVGRFFGPELAAIFEAHSLLLADQNFAGSIESRIRNDRTNAEWAVHETTRELAGRFSLVENEYLRERGEDLEDVGRQLLRTLQGLSHHDISELEGDVIVVADDLVPSEAIRLGRGRVVGFAIESGGRTSHTSIIARSLGIPAVTALPGLCELVTDDDPLILDGGKGRVILHPTPEALAFHGNRRDVAKRAIEGLETAETRATTADGVEIELLANIDLPEEIPGLARYGARGVGLYRSEFLYMETDPRLPTEEDHYRIYRALLEASAPYPATIRTYDLGGRKLAREMMESEEANPVLGLRGIRLTLARPQIFRTQIRALLRAGLHGDLWVMAPMVSRVEEIAALRAFIETCARELETEGTAFSRAFRLGVMIEVPAAAMLADHFATHADFLAIGTNDLIQYALAVDRNNEHVADLYQPLHPAILRMIRFVIESAAGAGVPVSLCGEMAGDPECLPALVGLGLRRFSVHPRTIPEMRSRIRSVDAGRLARLAKRACDLATAAEVASLFADEAREGERQGAPRP